jgi:diamine N-acetyltransferase
MKLLARAYAYREYRSKAVVIYNDEVPVGMALYFDCEELQAYDFCQLFIDEGYQGMGYGYEATKQILKLMNNDGKYNKVVLCYIEGNKTALSLYEKCGFKLTGGRDGDEIIMELSF